MKISFKIFIFFFNLLLFNLKQKLKQYMHKNYLEEILLNFIILLLQSINSVFNLKK